MNHWPDNWQDPYDQGWPPILGLHGAGWLPAEFRRENQDLKVPLREDQLYQMTDFWHILP